MDDEQDITRLTEQHQIRHPMVDKAIDGLVTDHCATVLQRQCAPMLDADGARQPLRAGAG